ncbi:MULTISPECIES: amidohydrolase family protein [unclassified Microbacterium]|uniref:amidohydrolase family protein n=1 Tax=unclassified Microbacterium TaxID=2609290 RepID=UPI00364CFAA3
MRVLDSHLHLWDPSRLDYEWLDGPLAQRYAAEELARASVDGAERAAAIFVQAECVEAQFIDEARWVADNAARTGVIGIVAGARLDRGAQTTAHLTALTGIDAVVGVRHNLQDEPDGTARSDAFRAGAAALAAHGYRFDACVRAHQLSDVADLAASVPALPIALDHLGKPAIGTAADPLSPAAAWLGDLRDLAAHPQVSVKLSGLPAEAGGSWSPQQVIPFLDAAAEAFGADRLLWGGDWPVSALTGAPPEYRTESRDLWARTVADWAGARGLDADAIFWDNAARFYGVE